MCWPSGSLEGERERTNIRERETRQYLQVIKRLATVGPETAEALDVVRVKVVLLERLAIDHSAATVALHTVHDHRDQLL